MYRNKVHNIYNMEANKKKPTWVFIIIRTYYHFNIIKKYSLKEKSTYFLMLIVI